MEDFSLEKKPSGWKKKLLKAPALLFKYNLNPFLFKKLILLEHTGRKTGKKHKTPLQPIKIEENCVYVVSGYGKKSDWYKNIIKNPKIKITIGKNKYKAKSKPLNESKGEKLVMEYFENHPISGCLVAKIFHKINCKKENYKKLAKSIPVMKFKTKSKIK